MRSLFRLVIAVVLLAVPAQAALRAEFGDVLGPEPVTGTQRYTVTIEHPESLYAVDVQAMLRQGSGELKIFDPAGAEVYQHLWGEQLSKELAPLGPLKTAGVYRIQVETDGAVGEWRARIVEVPEASQLRATYLIGPLLAIIGLGFLLGWRLASGAPWRWFAVGAGVRMVSALLALIVLVVYYLVLRPGLEDALPYSQYLILDSGIMGAVSGLASVVAYLLAGVAFSGARRSAANAIALGVGAGAGETLVSSIVTIAGTGMLFGGSPKSGKWMLQLAYDTAVTPLLPLVEPTKFVCVMLCLMATAGLAVMTVASRRWGALFGAFLLLAGFYAAIGAARVWALDGAASKWWILCGALPFAVVSVLVIRWCRREWPPAVAPDEAPMEAFLREARGAGEGTSGK